MNKLAFTASAAAIAIATTAGAAHAQSRDTIQIAGSSTVLPFASIVAEELFWDLDGPIVRVTTPHVPLAAANNLEDLQIPSADRIVARVRELVD